MDNMTPATGELDGDTYSPRGFRDPLVARWAHVLSALDVTCDPEDVPEHWNLLPDFGDHEGTLFYCEACSGPTWRPSIVQSACTLVAMAQCWRVVLLGDFSAGEPPIALVSLPDPGQWSMGLPFIYRADLRLRIQRTRPGHHAAMLVDAQGEGTIIGPDRSRHHQPWALRTDAQIVKLLAHARKMSVAGFEEAA